MPAPRLGDPNRKPLLNSSIPVERLSQEQRDELKREEQLAAQRAEAEQQPEPAMSPEEIRREENEKQELLARLRAERKPKPKPAVPEPPTVVPDAHVVDGAETLPSIATRVGVISTGLRRIWLHREAALRDLGRTCASHPELQVRGRLMQLYSTAANLHEQLRIALVECQRAERALETALAGHGGETKREFDRDYAVQMAKPALLYEPEPLRERVEAVFVEIAEIRGVPYEGYNPRGAQVQPDRASEIVVTLSMISHGTPRGQAYAAGANDPIV